MKNNLVSVIVPIYNVEKYLSKCIESILGQSYKNLEVILVDDGSKDSCGKIIDEYAKKDKRIVAIHQKNGGQSRARNVGIEKAKGEFISFVDGDDEIDKNFISELIKSFENNAVNLSVCGMKYKRLATGSIDDVYIKKVRSQKKNEPLCAYITFLLAISGRMYSSVNKIYKANVIKKHGLAFEEGVNFAEDTRFVLNYIKVANGKIDFVLKPLYIYNFGTEGSTIRKTGVNWENWQKFYEFLKKWDKNKWTKLVFLRWKVSYFKTKMRAKN